MFLAWSLYTPPVYVKLLSRFSSFRSREIFIKQLWVYAIQLNSPRTWGDVGSPWRLFLTILRLANNFVDLPMKWKNCQRGVLSLTGAALLQKLKKWSG